MKIIISPAKKMNIDTDSLAAESLPQFLPEANILLNKLKSMSYDELKDLWKCSESLAKFNYERLKHTDLEHNLTPSILSYEGIQYQYMAPGIFENQQFHYIKEHLRILSGLYGILKPFDGVSPYRLEMQAKLSINEHRNLYKFWGEKIARNLSSETDFILNLASKEYSKAVSDYLSCNIGFITCTFAEIQNGKLVEKGTQCKMARGEMVRYLAEKNIYQKENIKEFDRLGYTYSELHSDENNIVFIKQQQKLK